MTADQFVVSSTNLSYAWALVFLRSIRVGAGDACPLVVTVTGFNKDGTPVEDTGIREALDERLSDLKPSLDCHMVANTIFPERLWNPNRPRQELYDRYERIWPAVRRIPRNRRGVYFRRLVAFDEANDPVNQLEHIIQTWRRGNHRRSALQAAVFDPRHDHSNSRQSGFPCLHQVAFLPLGAGTLSVTGFYGLQYLYQRSYGNYMGLCRLGRFVAHEMGLKLVRMTCIAAAAKLGANKSDLRRLAERVQGLVPAGELEQIGADHGGN